MTAGTGSDIGSSDWTAGIGSPGIKSFGLTASTASSGKAVGSESTGMTAGTGADIESSGWTAGIGSPGIRSFGSTAGTASSGKAVGSESTGTTVGTGSSGTGLSGSTAGIGVTRHQVI
ncbi:unnamed protein product [Staurois parvus]|uniref:Uncharacterized protein n=1 Tax=Staurois parvus TaxID=386267 RepID=A0ABN9DE95_9NEOB|nr:unnamed protein product [Staurois parvus]